MRWLQATMVESKHVQPAVTTLHGMHADTFFVLMHFASDVRPAGALHLAAASSFTGRPTSGHGLSNACMLHNQREGGPCSMQHQDTSAGLL